MTRRAGYVISRERHYICADDRHAAMCTGMMEPEAQQVNGGTRRHPRSHVARGRRASPHARGVPLGRRQVTLAQLALVGAVPHWRDRRCCTAAPMHSCSPRLHRYSSVMGLHRPYTPACPLRPPPHTCCSRLARPRSCFRLRARRSCAARLQAAARHRAQTDAQPLLESRGPRPPPPGARCYSRHSRRHLASASEILLHIIQLL